jgi:protein TonB
VKSAQLIKSVPPDYPQLAKAQRVVGNVEIDALIDASGNVATLKVLSGPIILRQAALDSVKQWKFSPALLDGQPTAMHIAVTVQFRTQ